MKSDPIRILAVDDEPRILHTLRRFCRNEDLHLLEAASASEAFELLEHQEFEMIISDHRMPGITGLEFLKEAARRYPHIPGVLLSGYADLPAVSQALEEKEIFGFLAKPWKREELLALVRQAGEARCLSREDGP